MGCLMRDLFSNATVLSFPQHLEPAAIACMGQYLSLNIQSLYSAVVQFSKLQPWRGAPLRRVWLLTDGGFNANGLSDPTPAAASPSPPCNAAGNYEGRCSVQQHHNFRRVLYSMRVGEYFGPLTELCRDSLAANVINTSCRLSFEGTRNYT